MKNLYEIYEVCRKGTEKYSVYMTEDEVRAFLKTKREMYGYIEGFGGDKSYDAFAVLCR